MERKGKILSENRFCDMKCKNQEENKLDPFVFLSALGVWSILLIAAIP
jgi:hypothetical protein